jgi:hypothetical protein
LKYVGDDIETINELIISLVGKSVNLMVTKVHWLFKFGITSDTSCTLNSKPKNQNVTNVTWVLEVEPSPQQAWLHCHDLGGNIIAVLT